MAQIGFVSLLDNQPQSTIFDADLTVSVGGKTTTIRCKEIRLYKSGKVVGWTDEAGDMVVAHIVNSMIHQPIKELRGG